MSLCQSHRCVQRTAEIGVSLLLHQYTPISEGGFRQGSECKPCPQLSVAAVVGCALTISHVPWHVVWLGLSLCGPISPSIGMGAVSTQGNGDWIPDGPPK